MVPVCFAYLRGRLYMAVDEKPKRVAPAALRRCGNAILNTVRWIWSRAR